MNYKIFIGSSNERKNDASAIQSILQNARQVSLEPICWFHYGRPGEHIIETLIRGLNESAFGVFIMAPDDYMEMRGDPYWVPRDNVLLEVGMFLGGMGRKNTFLICPKDGDTKKFHLPSDLSGVQYLTYPSHFGDDNIRAKFNSACMEIEAEIVRQIKKNGGLAGSNKVTLERNKVTLERDDFDSRKAISERIKRYQDEI